MRCRDLEWNVDDKLTRVVDDGVEVASYAYDGAGRRVGSVIGGVSKRYLVAPNVGDGYETPQAVTDDAGNLIAAYVFSGEHPIARITPTGVEYYLQDSMGSVIGAADSAGTLSASVKYDSFGEVVSATGTAAASSAVGGDFRLHGMWLDEVSGLYHVRARTYDASTGRFLSRDPVAGLARVPETMNPYAFCRHNGRVWVDPSGRMTLIQTTIVIGIIGILAPTGLPAYNRFRHGPRALNVGFNYAGADLAAGMGDALSFTVGKALRDVLGGEDEIDESSPAYLAGMASGLVLQLWRSYAIGLAGGIVGVEGVRDGAWTAEQLAGATEGVIGNGGKVLGAAQLLSRTAGMSPQQKLSVMMLFFKHIGFIIGKSGVVQAGDDLIVYSDDAMKAFRFTAGGQIQYGRFSAEAMDYIWAGL